MEFDVKQLIPNPISKQTTSMFIKQKWQNHQNSTPCSCLTFSNKKNQFLEESDKYNTEKSKKNLPFFRSPLVPVFCPSIGLVGIEFICTFK